MRCERCIHQLGVDGESGRSRSSYKPHSDLVHKDAVKRYPAQTPGTLIGSMTDCHEQGYLRRRTQPTHPWFILSKHVLARRPLPARQIVRFLFAMHRKQNAQFVIRDLIHCSVSSQTVPVTACVRLALG